MAPMAVNGGFGESVEGAAARRGVGDGAISHCRLPLCLPKGKPNRRLMKDEEC